MLLCAMDALAISIAMIKINIWYPFVIIGLITSSLALLGIAISNHTIQSHDKTCEIIGGIILSAISFCSLFSHN